jgi:chromosome segregation ATPase
MAEATGFTIPIERPKNRETRHKLVEKKREMFLVQQMLETKRDEIERLTEHATMREDGLTCSENMLETDTKAFLKFFNEIKKKTQDASRDLDLVRKEKNDKTNDLRKITEDIQILISNISKNIESLEQYNNYKMFLDSLASV